jgi:hypothetical protein
VTEYGVADLVGRTEPERAEELIKSLTRILEKNWSGRVGRGVYWKKYFNENFK